MKCLYNRIIELKPVVLIFVFFHDQISSVYFSTKFIKCYTSLRQFIVCELNLILIKLQTISVNYMSACKTRAINKCQQQRELPVEWRTSEAVSEPAPVYFENILKKTP